MGKKQNNRKVVKSQRKSHREKEEETLAKLQERIDAYDPVVDEKSISQFSDLPISEETARGLKEASFASLTDIQKKTIPISLKGEDVMGTAKTGSGKTLAFLIPTIESLIRNKITEYDGLAALIISPTRELAVQIFEVLVKIGKHNNFSAGLVTGGKDVKYEKERVSKMNILVGTPGRISQHLNESVGMETSNLQVLVLDEADRCLDMGFKKQIDNILGHLPPTRQTLLFSATQSDSVKDLARLSLANPKRVGISSDQELSATPESLEQYYIKIPLDEKLDVLWSFIKSHLKSKILVFFSSSKQVQYAYETFRTLQPGISLLKLYGRHKQTSRMETTMKFSQAQHACLFATDIVARGLDFPAIDWVVQIDCPEDAATYVHRVGRAARFGRAGKSLMMLLPSEENGMLKRLNNNKIELKFMNIKQKNKKTIRPQLQSLCFQDPMIKNLGQRAFISYFRSVYVQKDKDIFKIDELPSDKFARSLGLPGAPKIKFKGGSDNKEKKNMSRQLAALSKSNNEGDVVPEEDKKVRTKYDRMFERKNQTILSDHYLNLTGSKADTAEKSDDDDEDFMAVKRQDHELRDDELPDLSIPVSKRSAKKALSKKASVAGKGNANKLKFDDDGVAHAIYELEDEEDFKKQGDARVQKDTFLNKETELMNNADIEDKLTAKEKRQEKKRKRKEMEKNMRQESDDEDENIQTVVSIGGDDIDLDRDLEHSSADEDVPEPKKPKWFDNDKNVNKDEDDGVVEYDEPQTLEDLEALTSKLLEH
ncbi:DEHA2B03322p [Debaryomyces hansenii CBS767]|uniref:ATP-dependent RNA helicase DBP4 n=1 Tax=Debaryomyces hansenii (strain ATCC 36239 / CBS 767 / BCRC 21394 / JCM 1990 / NBRC 0083 / IGC 2968) TaxID=284592 RepID=DBP4_DEBHA|nr:DEHA2B03322p [Debaryomyces hansenii CBS767]Q6BXG0.2 RecName: Full=ATP-dependent RNA helicase DBP4 [Debaryomyces hansenii CBS767]CAG85100.2 DEHA2B03322p [Debaryomyces hansenii CBS767]|eukprot:XP_457109.2 DEHA2B03322p [Debaryomyces hansenii CBS767]